MNSVYVISLTIAIVLVIGIFLYIISRPNEKFSTVVSPLGYTKLYGNIVCDNLGDITVNPISSTYLVSGYNQSTLYNPYGNSTYGYTLVNTSSNSISNINITITSPNKYIPVWLYNLDGSGNSSAKPNIYNLTATTTTYNYVPSYINSASNIIPPGGSFVIDMTQFWQYEDSISFTINNITIS